MASKLKNLVVIIVVLIIIGGVWFYTSQPKAPMQVETPTPTPTLTPTPTSTLTEKPTPTPTPTPTLTPMEALEFEITCPVFKNNDSIPVKYTCDGDDVNPPLNIKGIPKEAKSLVLIVDDPDARMGTWVHWIVWNIPPAEEIEENSVPGIEGLNAFNKHAYRGPCPSSGTHRYFFKIYVLDTELDIDTNSRKEDVERAMEGYILAKGEIIGLYRR